MKKIEIEFDRRDDMGFDNRDRISGTCLTIDESRTEKWIRKDGDFYPRILRFKSDRSVSEIIENFEDEGFYMDEFKSFKVSN